jgi:hypothetical protein
MPPWTYGPFSSKISDVDVDVDVDVGGLDPTNYLL